MIKQNELRIGNTLNYTTAENDVIPTKIDWQDLKWLSEYPDGFNMVHDAIRLNLDWLYKFGFETKTDPENSHYIIQLDKEFGEYFVLNRKVGFNVFYIRHIDCNDSVNFTTQIKSVHQLQNYFYAVTKQELTIKNK